LTETEDLLHRGIGCGAFADPWNILGFQALFPLFTSREDSVRDTRIDVLLDLVERVLDLYARLLSEAAASGQHELRQTLSKRLAAWATWWDQFASSTVSDVRPIQAGRAAKAAEGVAAALTQWHQRGDATGDLAFWKKHVKQFDSPRAFAQVVDALLRHKDY